MGGVDADFRAAMQGGRMQRRRPNEGVGRSFSELLLQFIQPGQKTPHVHVSIDALEEAAAMGGAAECFHIVPNEPSVSSADVQVSWLGDDGRICLYLLHQVITTDAGVLFIGHSSDQ